MDGSIFSRMVEMYKRIVVFMLTLGKTVLVPVFYDSYFLAALRLLEKLHKVNTSVLFCSTIRGNALYFLVKRFDSCCIVGRGPVPLV